MYFHLVKFSYILRETCQLVLHLDHHLDRLDSLLPPVPGHEPEQLEYNPIFVMFMTRPSHLDCLQLVECPGRQHKMSSILQPGMLQTLIASQSPPLMLLQQSFGGVINDTELF